MTTRVSYWLRAASVLTVLMAAAWIGCGGGSEGEGSEGPLTKVEFVKQGDAICKEGNDRYVSEYQQFMKSNTIEKGDYPSAQEGFRITREIYLPMIERRLKELQELVPPEADAEKVAAIFSATESGIAKVEKDVKVVTQGSTEPFSESKSLARTYGFKDCAL